MLFVYVDSASWFHENILNNEPKVVHAYFSVVKCVAAVSWLIFMQLYPSIEQFVKQLVLSFISDQSQQSTLCTYS